MSEEQIQETKAEINKHTSLFLRAVESGDLAYAKLHHDNAATALAQLKALQESL